MAERGKYSNRIVTLPDGTKFHSVREYERWKNLQWLVKAGEVIDLQRQTPFVLAPAVRLGGRVKPALVYLADFTYRTKTGGFVVEDAKGVRTDAYRIKQHLMKSVHGIDIVEV
jgi:hypothetical protein